MFVPALIPWHSAVVCALHPVKDSRRLPRLNGNEQHHCVEGSELLTTASNGIVSGIPESNWLPDVFTPRQTRFGLSLVL